MLENDLLCEAFAVLSTQAKDLFLDKHICEIWKEPTALEFSRENVAKNRPVVFRGACSKWQACKKWNTEFFRQMFGNKLTTVAVTPNGYADGIAVKMPENQEYFVLPEDQTMKMAEFLDKLDETDNRNVYYIQKQNSNLSEDFPELLGDIDVRTLDFAFEAFNKRPDAMNFWMGDCRAITSLHKDPYENMYCVISGYKDFILIPPTDYAYVPRSKYPTGAYKTAHNGEMFIDPVIDENGEPIPIEWVSVDPLNPDYNKHPGFRKCTPFKIRVNEGDTLYLPSLWYHHVQQSHKCIAVNFWFDMEYDARYCYYKFVEKLCGNGQ